MSNRKHILADSLFTLVILLGAFGLNLLFQNRFQTYTMTPMIFVLGVFLVSWRTRGYVFGIAASLLSVLAVNWAFTYVKKPRSTWPTSEKTWAAVPEKTATSAMSWV